MTGSTTFFPHCVRHHYPFAAAAECALMILAAGTVIASGNIYVNLRREPMQMFAEGKE